jgi:hypothetical protein
LHGDYGGHGQGLLQSDLQMHVQSDSCSDSRSEKEGDPQRDCRRDSQPDSRSDLQGHSGGEFHGDLRGDFHDPFAGRSEGEGVRMEKLACKSISGLTLGDVCLRRLFSCARCISMYNTYDFQRGLSIVQS